MMRRFIKAIKGPDWANIPHAHVWTKWLHPYAFEHLYQYRTCKLCDFVEQVRIEGATMTTKALRDNLNTIRKVNVTEKDRALADKFFRRLSQKLTNGDHYEKKYKRIGRFGR